MRTAGGRWGREMLVWGQGLGAGGQGGGCGWQAPGRKGQRAPGGCLSSCRRTRQVPDVGGGQLVAGLLELDEGRGVEAVVAAANVVDLSTRQGREGGGGTLGGVARRGATAGGGSRHAPAPPTTTTTPPATGPLHGLSLCGARKLLQPPAPPLSNLVVGQVCVQPLFDHEDQAVVVEGLHARHAHHARTPQVAVLQAGRMAGVGSDGERRVRAEAHAGRDGGHWGRWRGGGARQRHKVRRRGRASSSEARAAAVLALTLSPQLEQVEEPSELAEVCAVRRAGRAEAGGV